MRKFLCLLVSSQYQIGDYDNFVKALCIFGYLVMMKIVAASK